MNKRVLMALMVAAGVLLVAVIILLVVVRWQAPETSPDETTNESTTQTTTETTTTTSADTNTAEDTTTAEPVDDRDSIVRLARNFTERYGSYSTDTHYENIESSRSFMTAAMSQQADQVIANSEQTADTFSSIESVVTNVNITDFSDGATGATVVVEVRQSTIAGQSDPQYTNRRAQLTLKKDGAAWKIDSFRWLD